jgi:hypothetical protein
MAPWTDIPLVTQYGKDLAGGAAYASDADLINLMVRKSPPGSRVPFHITNTPCIANFAIMAGSGGIRGFCRNKDGTYFMIRGTSVYFLGSGGGTWTIVPSGNMPGSAICRMVDADTHVVAVDGTNARAITTSQSVACSRELFSDVAYQDGFTVFTETGTNRVYSSDVDDPTTINALHFTTADALGGNCVGLISDTREIFVFKTGSIEHFFNDGSSGFPFARSSPGLIEGSTFFSGKLTIAKYRNSVFWLGDDFRIYAMQGTVPSVISTPWVERLLQSVSSGSAPLYASTFSFDGAAYYVLSGMFETGIGYFSLFYDIGSGLWHRWASALNDGTNTGVSLIAAIETAGGDVRLAANSTISGRTYELTNTVFSDVGESGVHIPQTVTPTRVMVLPQYAPGGGRRTFMPELYLDMQKSSVDGTCNLQWSDDGGTTFNTAIAGNETLARTRWQRLGSFFHRAFKFTFAVASRVSIMGVRARVEVGE